MIEVDEVKKSVDRIHGYLADEEGELLYNLAQNCTGKGVIVEIGSWKGRSTIWLAKGSKGGSRVKVYAIDPHTGSSEHRKSADARIWTFEEFKRNIKNAEVDDVVVSIVKTSEETAKDFDKPVELIFIDGAHEYDLVKLDFDLWFPKVIDGGIMAFHDTCGSLGPKLVVKRMVYKSGNFKNARFVASITFAEKVKQNSMKDRFRNSLALFLKESYWFAERMSAQAGLHSPKPLRGVERKVIALTLRLLGWFQNNDQLRRCSSRNAS